MLLDKKIRETLVFRLGCDDYSETFVFRFLLCIYVTPNLAGLPTHRRQPEHRVEADGRGRVL